MLKFWSLNVKTSYPKRPLLHLIPFWDIIETYLTMQQNVSNCSQIKQWKRSFGDSLNCVSNVKKGFKLRPNWDILSETYLRLNWDLFKQFETNLRLIWDTVETFCPGGSFKIVPRALLLALACSFASYKRKEKKNICCVWNSSWLLGGVLTGSWLLLTFRDVPDWFLFSKNRQVYSRIIKKQTRRHQEAAETPPRSTKICQEVSRSVKEKKKCQEYFWKCQNISWSFPIDQEYWRSAKKLSRSLQEVITNDQELKFGTILVQNSYSGTAPRWTTRI